ncbi:MAG: flavodoxin [Thermoplasmata archaeon]|nr:flavodoxin [Thermoplasmata archaeon]
MSGKTLVAYFSASGVTADAARVIADVTKGDLFEIVPETRYSDADLNWRDSKSRSSVEMKDPKARPPISSRVDRMEEYGTVFVGFPIWWGVAPRIIDTFLESYDFSGKTLVPFCTSGGSGVGSSDAKLHKDVSPDVDWKPGKLIGRADRAAIERWIESLE